MIQNSAKSITNRHITSDLAIRTLKKALESQPTRKDDLVLHSDQGSQYTAKAFVEYCESVHVTQSLYEFQTEESLYQAVEEFAYITYNHVRPHSYNGYRTPFEARNASLPGKRKYRCR